MSESDESVFFQGMSTVQGAFRRSVYQEKYVQRSGSFETSAFVLGKFPKGPST